MKRHVFALALVLIAAPAFAQDREEFALRDLGMGGLFADGNLAMRDIQRGNDPVQQFKRFFAGATLPLTSAQEKRLESVVDLQIKTLQGGTPSEDTVRRVNQEFTRQLNEVLTADQRTALRRYRTEQIMMRGGFPALRLTLENAQAPFTPDQEKQAQSLYTEFNQQVNQLSRESKGAPDRAQLDKLENEALGKVVRILNPAQRKALIVSRQGSLPKAER
jgi:hypothetical protein